MGREIAHSAQPRRARPTRGQDEQTQHPATQVPPPSNSMVLPLSGTWAGTLTALTKASVLVPGRILPPLVATSFACEGITETGLTTAFITYPASVGPVVNVWPMFMTASLATAWPRT